MVLSLGYPDDFFFPVPVIVPDRGSLEDYHEGWIGIFKQLVRESKEFATFDQLPGDLDQISESALRFLAEGDKIRKRFIDFLIYPNRTSAVSRRHTNRGCACRRRFLVRNSSAI
jgi:hypothetical protein